MLSGRKKVTLPSIAERYHRRYLVSKNEIKNAVLSGEIEIVRGLASLGADVFPENRRDDMGNNEPIQLAIENNFIEIAEFLLQCGSEPNHLISIGSLKLGEQRYRWTLEDQAAKDNIKMMELLIDYGADITRTIVTAGRAFGTTMDNGEFFLNRHNLLSRDEKGKVEKTILEAKAHYQKVYKILFDYAMGCGFRSKMSELSFPYLKEINIAGFCFIGVSIDGVPVTREKLSQLGLIGAESAIVSLSDLEEMKDVARRDLLMQRLQYAIQKGGELVLQDGTVNMAPLCESAAVGDVLAVKTRLTAGIDPNVTTDYHPPIYLAAEHGHFEIVQLLASHSMINKESLVDALKVAKEKHYHNIVDYLTLLLDVNAKDGEGNSLLHLAARDSNLDDVSRLIACHADVNVLNDEYNKPLYISLIKFFDKNKNVETQIVSLLLNAGARVGTSELKKVAGYFADYTVFSMVVSSAQRQSQDVTQMVSTEILFSLLDSRDGVEKFKLLAQMGVKLDCQNSCGNSLIHEGIRILIKAARNINDQAVFKRRLEVVEYLLSARINTSLINTDKQDCLLFLISKNYHHLPPLTCAYLFDNLIKLDEVTREPPLQDALSKDFAMKKSKIHESLKECDMYSGMFNRRAELMHELSTLEASYCDVTRIFKNHSFSANLK